jgi:hypothetical protein
MKLEDKLRQGLLGHLSEANTVVDITIASSIAREFSIAFSVFVAENTFAYSDGEYRMRELIPTFKTAEELLKIFEDGL